MPAAPLTNEFDVPWCTGEGGGSNYGKCNRTDRRHSHSGIFFAGADFRIRGFLQGDRTIRLCVSSLGEAGATRGTLSVLRDTRNARSIANKSSAPGSPKTSIYFTGRLDPGGASQTLERCEPGPVG